jgi:hypothetical protein
MPNITLLLLMIPSTLSSDTIEPQLLLPVVIFGTSPTLLEHVVWPFDSTRCSLLITLLTYMEQRPKSTKQQVDC